MSSPTAAPPAAVLWDFDGTLLDTEPIWWESEFHIMASLGLPWSQQLALSLTGNSLPVSGAFMSTYSEGVRSPEWFVDEMVSYVSAQLRTRDLPWCPGAEELLDELRTRRVPCALVTASYREVVDAVISRIPTGSFQAVIVGDEVSRGKPHPEPYLTACERLGLDPRDTIALEDSIPGAASANAAGAVVIGLLRGIDVPEAPRRVLATGLEGLGLAELRRIWAHASGNPQRSDT